MSEEFQSKMGCLWGNKLIIKVLYLNQKGFLSNDRYLQRESLLKISPFSPKSML